MSAAERPTISVVICAYESRERIDVPLASLERQRLDEPYEVIVVASGEDGCAEHVRERWPEVRVVASRERLRPGPARNRGVAVARGEYIAFIPDDAVAHPDWLARRLAAHRRGHDAVGGSIGNGTPRSPLGTAGYFLEYSALIPSSRVLADQRIPHCLSYRRDLFDRFGTYPEDTITGEDSIFNERLLDAGIRFGFDPRARIDHLNPTTMRGYVRHHLEHGRGLVQCVERYGHPSPIGPARSPLALARAFLGYPARRWSGALGRIARGRPTWVPLFLAVSPLVWVGLWATGAGATREWRRLESADD
jgi:glycosyltransferase involved in cell wall biosynthesis